MFSKILTMKSTESYSHIIDRLKNVRNIFLILQIDME